MRLVVLLLLALSGCEAAGESKSSASAKKVRVAAAFLADHCVDRTESPVWLNVACAWNIDQLVHHLRPVAASGRCPKDDLRHCCEPLLGAGDRYTGVCWGIATEFMEAVPPFPLPPG